MTGVELDAVGNLTPQQLSQTGRRELRYLLQSHNLELTALACPLRRGLDVPDNQEARIDHLRQVMALSFDLGPRKVIVQAGKIPTDEKDPRFPWFKDALATLAEHGDRTGVTLTLETGLDAGQPLDAFLARFDSGSLGVNYNPANLLMNGLEPYQAGRDLQRRIVHAHAKDARTVSAARTSQEVPLGHGDLDWLQILGILEEIGYHGWLVVERNGSRDPLAEISSGLKFLRGLIG